MEAPVLVGPVVRAAALLTTNSNVHLTLTHQKNATQLTRLRPSLEIGHWLRHINRESTRQLVRTYLHRY
jgi:hypothetical protein